MSVPVRHVGLIGLGRMGLPICARLVEHGFEVVCTDLDGVRRELGARAGAATVGDSEGAAADVEVVVTVLPGPAEVAAVAEARDHRDVVRGGLARPQHRLAGGGAGDRRRGAAARGRDRRRAARR